MKKLILLFNLIGISLLFNCSQTANQKESNSNNSANSSVDKSLDSLKQRLHLDIYTVFEYNLNGQLISEKVYNNKHEQTSYKTTEYDSLGRIKNERDFKCCWTLFARYEYKYNPDSTLLKKTCYIDDKIYVYFVYSYDQNKREILTKSYNSDNLLDGEYENGYIKSNGIITTTNKENGKIISFFEDKNTPTGSLSKSFNAKHKITSSTENFKDINKNLIKQVEKDSSDIITEISEWVYKNNRPYYVKTFNRNGEIISLDISTYDETGKCVKKESYENVMDVK